MNKGKRLSNKSVYSSEWVYWTQHVWTLVVLALGVLFVAKCKWSLWFTIPIFIIGVAILWQIGLGLISLMDYNHRMAAKYSIKIENIPLYNNIFDEMVKKEEQGIDTSGIPEGINDVQEWLRFCRWQIDRELNSGK
ncbi:MAG: hypothetical protein SOV62_00550 [Alloprevotella sp.]|nr:hypothetical protein [Alloprevotella sp.]